MSNLCAVVALEAPPGQGVAALENGQLSGDNRIIDRAKQIKQVSLVIPAVPEDMDWDDPAHVAEALKQGAEQAYGGEVIVLTEPLGPEDPPKISVEPSGPQTDY
jgi:hypothetical protein